MVPNECDVVVIGAGIGGLTSAALLAKAGLRVCVLEMDARPGGYLAGFQRKEFIFDTAILWLNQCGPGGSVRRVLDFIDPSSPKTPPLRQIRRYRGDSIDYVLTDHPDEFRDRLVADFPDQAPAIRRFFRAARSIGDAFTLMADHSRARETMSLVDMGRHGMAMAKVGMRFLKYSRWSTEDGFDRLFPAPALKQVFCSEEQLLSCLSQVGWAYTGDYQVPPPGGSQEFPRFLVGAIQDWEGRIFYRAHVDRVLVDGGKVTGVSFTLGRSSPEEHTIRAKYVLAACDLESLYERMLPAGTIDPELVAKLRNADLYDSSVTIAIGLDTPPRELGFGEELVMLTRDDVSRKDHNCGDPNRAGISVLAPSLRDPTLAPKGKGTLTLLTTANIEYGEKWKTTTGFKRGIEYKQFKRDYADIVIERVERALAPGLRNHIEVCEIATPVTHQRYTGNRDGSIMAAKPSWANIRNKVAHYITPVENLFLSGHWAEYGGGVPIAVRAAANAALLVMRHERPQAFSILAEVLDGKLAPDGLHPDCLRKLSGAS